jgi:hypothetical protein
MILHFPSQKNSFFEKKGIVFENFNISSNNIINVYNICSHLSKACSKKLFSFSLQEALDFGNGQNLLGQVGMGV